MKVDPSDVLPDGQKFNNIDEFKKLLLANKDQVALALTRKLLTYATGGPPEDADQEQVEAIVKKVREKNYGLRTLVQEIVQSELFRSRSSKTESRFRGRSGQRTLGLAYSFP